LINTGVASHQLYHVGISSLPVVLTPSAVLSYPQPDPASSTRLQVFLHHARPISASLHMSRWCRHQKVSSGFAFQARIRIKFPEHYLPYLRLVHQPQYRLSPADYGASVFISLAPLGDGLNRSFTLSPAKTSIEIGRASKTTSKGLAAAKDNAWFDSPIMSRSHAELNLATTADQVSSQEAFEIW